mmetsp:Transcript_14377/g.15940  ORF Transcript_14377/g.15940 Transcript_14377/m.15940 type:complete len:253 (-) Transcript_14377:45-803(-)
MRLNGFVILLTGGGGAIGYEMARKCASEGAIVCLSDICAETGQACVDKIVASGGKAVFARVDVSNEKQVQMWVNDIYTRYNRIDVLINNATLFIFGNVEQASESDWDKVLAVGIKGYAFTAKAVLPYMKKAKKGSIINMGSISSFIGQNNFIPYNTVKSAVLGMTRCMAMDYGKYNIRVNTLCPGAIETPATWKAHPTWGKEELLEHVCKTQFLKRVATPVDLGGPIVFLASDESAFMTGQSILVDGGRTAM